MKQYFLPAIKMTLFSFLLLVVIYTALVWGIAQAAPNQGQGETVTTNGRVVGYKNVGQQFNQDSYFWSRPSAVDYNAAGSGGSNKGASNPAYLQTVQARIDTFLIHHPGVAKAQIPGELVTASGSGLDPNLSPAGALVQVKRIAAIRNLPEQTVRNLILQQIEKPLAGAFGPEKINLLQLNLALDQLTNNK